MTPERSAGIDPRWRKLLRRHLSRREFERLRQISHNWTRNPFEFDRESGRFEVAERWPWGRGPDAAEVEASSAVPLPAERAWGASGGLWEEPTEWEYGDEDDRLEADLDVILKACDVLSDHLAELEVEAMPGRERADEAGAMTLTYEFSEGSGAPAAGDLEVGRRFVRLLEGQDAFRLVEEDLGSVRRVRVEFRFRGEFDYQSKKSHLDWTLELARRLKEGRPFQGRRF